jgi:antitoxin CcdA
MASKKAVNVSIDGVLLQRAKMAGLNLSASLERGLRAEVASIEAKRWQLENAEAIAAWNKELEDNGLCSDGLRLF